MNYTLTMKDGEKFTITDAEQDHILKSSTSGAGTGAWLKNRYIAFSSIASIIEDYSPDPMEPTNAPQLPEPRMSGNKTKQENLTRMVKAIKQGILDSGHDPKESEFFKSVLKKKDVQEIIRAFRHQKA